MRTVIIITKIEAEQVGRKLAPRYLVELNQFGFSGEMKRFETLYEGTDGDAAYTAAEVAQKREFGLDS